MTIHMTFDQLFTYGQTREHYAVKPGERINTEREILALVRPEHLATLREAVFHDRAILDNCSGRQWQLRLSPVTRQCLWEMHSGIFLRLLENITGYTQLLPDAKCHFLKLHSQIASTVTTENRQDPETGLPVILYLFLGLDSGNAILASANGNPVTINEPSLQFAFLYFSGNTI